MTGEYRKTFWCIAGALAVFAFFSALRIVGVLEKTELIAIDAGLRFDSRSLKPSGRIAIVSVDDNSINYLRYNRNIQWKWPRDIYALIINYMERCGAEAVAVDFLFSDPDITLAGYAEGETDEALAKAYKSFGKVYQTMRLHTDAIAFQQLTDDSALRAQFALKADGVPKGAPEGKIIEWPILPLLHTARAVGVTNIEPDRDGVIRRFAPLHKSGESAFQFLPLRLVPDLGQLPLDNGRAWINHPGQLPLDNGRAWIRWYGLGGPGGAYPYYPAAEVFLSELQAREGKTPLVSCDQFAGKIVFLGSNAGALFDLKQTPMATSSHPYPGVEILATVADNLLQGHTPRRMPSAIALAIILAMSAAGFAGAFFMKHARTFLLAAVILHISYAGAAFMLFRRGLIPDIVGPEFALAASVIGGLVINYIFEGREQLKTKRALNQYVSPAVAERVIRHPELLRLGGDRRVLTVLFSDIRDFTTLSESLEPEDLVQFLNEYFNRMTGIIIGEGGTLDKYVGDAIMAFTGAPDAPRPDDAARICRAALQMVDAIDEMNATWAAKWGRRLRTGVGISTGSAVVGNMGSDMRFDYTAMGDTVNIASRLEGINKEWGTRIIASNATKTAAGEGFVWRPLDEIMLKGKTRGVLAWELLGLSGNERAEWLAASFARLREALATRRFEEADRLADMILDRVPDDGPTRKLMNRGK